MTYVFLLLATIGAIPFCASAQPAHTRGSQSLEVAQLDPPMEGQEVLTGSSDQSRRGQREPTNQAVSLPAWFHEIDTADRGYVTRAEFVNFRMKIFDQLDTKNRGKLTLEEFSKIVEPPFAFDGSTVP